MLQRFFPTSFAGKLHRCFGLFLIAALPGVPAALAIDTKLIPEQTDFFEKKIRPIFAENCYKCHSHDSEKVKGGLLLDTREGVLKGGDTGPALVAGDPDKSLMIQAVRYKNKDLQMPPNDRQLSVSQIADLEAWVKMGAPDPRTGADDARKYVVDFDKAKKHWSFQPIKKPEVPEPEDAQHWAKTPVDQFILASLATNNLKPSARADKVTLIRRVTFDLIGLPPTPKEMEDFVADTSTNAFATVVDRLLASPHYGERWGRHWLDIAHYADTRGVIGGNRDERYPYSYVYRDYVIRSFNEDLPYDQFLLQQIAADKLPQTEDKHSLAALGFLTLGNRFGNQMNDIIDDRIDIVGKGTMGLTVTCARCHDHKFDPIPTKDYYALHGVFNSSPEPKEEPLVETPKNSPAYQAFCREYAAKEVERKDFHDENVRRFKGEMINKSASYLLALHDFKRKTNNMALYAFADKRGLFPELANVWNDNMRNWERKHNPVMAPWVAFEQLNDADFAAKAKELSTRFAENADKAKPINPAIARLFNSPPSSLSQLAARYQSVFATADQEWTQVLAVHESKKKSATNAVADLKGLDDPGLEQVRQLMYANYSPLSLDEQRMNRFVDRDNKMRNKRNELERAMSELIVTHPGSPARAPALEDMDKGRDSYVMIKGNPGNRGPLATRHFLTILAGDNPPLFKQGSGRLELAQAIASKNNPLTARVFVNRVWLYHFGEGLVRTPDDFGTRGEAPSHPELLDYLAARFMDDSWSLKKLHRLILLSSVYQQSSDDNPRFEQIDPDNRWLWRMNRRRLDFESLRDTILAIGGDLDLTMGGRPVKLDAEPYSLRRTVYGFVDRRNLPNMFRAFDFASPDLTTGKRESTVVPQQALFMMNSPLVVEQARNVVRRADFKTQSGAEARVELLYRLIYQRDPTETETKLALDYIRSDATTEWQTNAVSAWEYGYGVYDPGTRRTRLFVPMGAFANRTWQPGNKQPDERLKGLALTPTGGTPGKPYAVIRRWTAPRDGFISIAGTLEHPAKDGDGVQGRIVSNRSGELGSWVAFGNQSPTPLPRLAVKKDEIIDFVVDCRENPKNDTFKWAPIIKMEPKPDQATEKVALWDAQRDFNGDLRLRRLTPWEKFAQVLLETNELTFVN